LKYRVLTDKLAVCQLSAGSPIPEWAVGAGFFCITQTAEELSIVCAENRVPSNVRIERDWVALKLEGPFPFAMTGVLASFLQPLADAGIPIFAVSTFDTDYVLIKREKLEAAIAALNSAGHELVQPSNPAL
jgi:uncharacterized protein